MNCFKSFGEKDKSCGTGLYFVGFVGAAIWFISQAVGFWEGVIGFLKAIVWPGFLIYQAFEFLAK
jgi:hypothetical protein